MLGLALDSAGGFASTALWTDETGRTDAAGRTREPDQCDAATPFTLLGYRALLPKTGKADQLILVVEQLLGETGRGYLDLDVIAVNRGPGSFTGIRSAVALGRGLALAAKRPVLGVTTHEARAANIGRDEVIGSDDQPESLMIVEDARRGEVYRQDFGVDGRPSGAIAAESPDQAAKALTSGRWCLAGSGAALVLDGLNADQDGIGLRVAGDAGLDARDVALAAHIRLASGEAPIPGFDLRPLYIRPPDAALPKPLVTPISRSAEASV